MRIAVLLAAAMAAAAACGISGVGAVPELGRLPLIDLTGGTYLGFRGGLYPGGSNAIPSTHASVGVARGQAVQPLDGSGVPSPSGKYVLLSVGMSNTTQEWCSQIGAPPCNAWSFMGRAASDPAVDHAGLVVINGAIGGAVAESWDAPTDPDYDRVRDTRLGPAGLTERQVQVVWLKVVHANPTVSLPSGSADAYRLETSFGAIVRALRVRYPNLRQVFLSSRIYGGYATTTLHPEPYAYESGFAVKWVIQAQIDQMQSGGAIVDPRAGDLNYNTVAAWLAWSAYLWADGVRPRSDGLIWERMDFGTDGTHPSPSGEEKVANLLMAFFKTSSVTRCWFLAVGTCG